ncbi:hypothetical protein V6N11_050629 [Hibiscus sabdariffa]|uniref:Uncharacterized protein n=2 Tax=Hibiscus sabdariffa TaxID=183260 RepID=A0ABR2BX88_9ROSI
MSRLLAWSGLMESGIGACQTFTSWDTVLRIAAVKGSRYGSIADVVGWHGTIDLHFIVKSTYMARCGQESGSDHNVWRVLHRYKGLPQVKCFL